MYFQVNGYARDWARSAERRGGAGAHVGAGRQCRPRRARAPRTAHTRAAHRAHGAAVVGLIARKRVLAHIRFPLCVVAHA